MTPTNPTEAQMELAREALAQAATELAPPSSSMRMNDFTDKAAQISARAIVLAIQATEARAQGLVEAERERGWNGAIKTLDEWLVKAMNETVFAKETTIEHQEATRGAFRASRGAAASLLCRDETGFLVDAETPERIAAAIKHSKYGGERER